MSISKIFTPNFLCVLTNERYKLYQKGFPFCHTGHAPGWAGGAQGVNFFFSNMVMWHIILTGMTSRTKVRSKGQISLNFRYHVNFNYLYRTLRVFSQIKDREHIEQNFHSVARIMGLGRGLGCWGGGSKTLAWGFAMAPHWLRIQVITFVVFW